MEGTAMAVLMRAAEWPLAQHLSDGSPGMSTDPLVDHHVPYAAILVVPAVSFAGRGTAPARR